MAHRYISAGVICSPDVAVTPSRPATPVSSIGRGVEVMLGWLHRKRRSDICREWALDANIGPWRFR